MKKNRLLLDDHDGTGRQLANLESTQQELTKLLDRRSIDRSTVTKHLIDHSTVTTPSIDRSTVTRPLRDRSTVTRPLRDQVATVVLNLSSNFVISCCVLSKLANCRPVPS
jgi:hypothetical protein